METALPIRYRRYLQEVEIKHRNGFKSGIISFISRTSSHRIVRIKLKYADSSIEFYKSLLKRFIEQFGQPSEYRGDLFHILEGWKWSFVDQEENKISLILQHNNRDTQQKMGNCVKLTLWNLIDEERCKFGKQPSKPNKKGQNSQVEFKGYDFIDWERFLPH